MKIICKLYFVLLLVACSGIAAHAQVQVLEKGVLEKIQNGHTHVVVSDIHFPTSSEFLSVFKSYWTLTKGVDFISANDLPGNLIAGDTYFSLETLRVTGSYGGSAMFIYLNLWLPTEKALKDKKFKVGHEDPMAHILLSADVETILHGYFADKDFGFDFDARGHIYHWNPGILKNYLQLLAFDLKTSKKIDSQDDITDYSQLKLLKGQTLYCPEDNLNKMGTFVKVGKTVDIKDVFEDYKFNYQSISDKDLGEKIMAAKEPFYYLLFVRNSTSKLIVVVNSITGEIIYSRYDKSMSIPNLKSGDLKDLYKTINKN